MDQIVYILNAEKRAKLAYISLNWPSASTCQMSNVSKKGVGQIMKGCAKRTERHRDRLRERETERERERDRDRVEIERDRDKEIKRKRDTKRRRRRV